MAAPEHPNTADVAKFFTRGVKFPRLIGTTADGTRIPGGPYTMLQAVGGLLAFGAAQGTKALWSNGSLISDLIVLAAVTGCVVYALRFVRVGGRNPASVLIGVLGVLSQPKYGRLQGRRVRVRRPHGVRGVVRTLALPDPATAGSTPPAAPAIHGDGLEVVSADQPSFDAPPAATALYPQLTPLDELIFAIATPAPAAPGPTSRAPATAPQATTARRVQHNSRTPSVPPLHKANSAGVGGTGATSSTAVARLLAQAAAKQSVS